MSFLGKVLVVASLLVALFCCNRCCCALGPDKGGDSPGANSRYMQPGREKVVHAVDSLSMVSCACATRFNR